MGATQRIAARVEQAYPLIEEIAAGRAVLFAGAGLSFKAKLPGWWTLLRNLDRALGTGLGEPRGELTRYAQRLDEAVGRERLGAALRRELTSPTGPTDVQRALARLPFHAVFTTNFDQLLEAAYAAEGRRFDPIRYDEEVGVLDPQVAVPIVKFHGDLDNPRGVVLTSADYEAYPQRHPAFRSLFEALLATQTFFFVGFGLTDPNFLALDQTVRKALGRYRRHAYALIIERAGRRVPDVEPYHYLAVGRTEVDDFLLALTEEVERIRNRQRHATQMLLAALEPAQRAVECDVASLPAELIAPPSERPFVKPTNHPDASELRPRVYALVEQADALGVSEPGTWRGLGNALFHLKQYRGALRALGRLPQDDREASFTAARCHWYREDYWRARRLLDPLVYRNGSGEEPADHLADQPDQVDQVDLVDVRYLDGFPTAVAMYAYGSNWVAEEHLERGRYHCARAVAGRGLRALQAWLEDPEPPQPFPGWLWSYLYLHLGRGHLLLLLSGEPAEEHAREAEAALRQAATRRPKWLEPRLELMRLGVVTGVPSLEAEVMTWAQEQAGSTALLKIHKARTRAQRW